MSGSCSRTRARTETLLLAPREHVAPRPPLVEFEVELADEAAEAGVGEDLGDRKRVEVFAAARIGHELVQRQMVGEVGLLRGEEDPRTRGDPDAALAVGQSPATAFNSELLPQPLGPLMCSRSPSRSTSRGTLMNGTASWPRWQSARPSIASAGPVTISWR